jgi:hypothetical protein
MGHGSESIWHSGRWNIIAGSKQWWGDYCAQVNQQYVRNCLPYTQSAECLFVLHKPHCVWFDFGEVFHYELQEMNKAKNHGFSHIMFTYFGTDK